MDAKFSIGAGSVPVLSPDAALERIGDETFIATKSGNLISFSVFCESPSLDKHHEASAVHGASPIIGSPVAEVALALADGTRSIGEISQKVAMEFDVSAKIACDDLVRFFSELAEAGAFRMR